MPRIETAEAAEKATVGAMMISDWAADQGLLLLRPEHFYHIKPQSTFIAIKRLRSRTHKADFTTVHEETKLTKVVDFSELMEFANFAVIDLHLPYYASCVRKSYLDRDIKAKAISLASDNSDSIEKSDELRKVCVEREAEDSPRVFSLTENLQETLKDLESKPPDKMTLGVKALNDVIGGVESGDLLTVGARTGRGKTALMVKLALEAARQKWKVCYFSGEMSASQLLRRMLSGVANVPASAIRNRDTRLDWGRITAASESLNELPLTICDIPSPSLGTIETVAFQNKAQIIVVDYLQRCELPHAKEHRIRIQEFMVGLKNLCRLRGLIGILGCQVNRQTDRSADTPPTLADLRESSSIEEESDQVVLLWAPSESWNNYGDLTLDAIVAKNRHGPTGMTKLLFRRQYVDIVDEGQPSMDYAQKAAGEKEDLL